MSNADFYKSKMELDSIYKMIKEGKYTFEEAAMKFSDDMRQFFAIIWHS